jgi:hypothetical protein
MTTSPPPPIGPALDVSQWTGQPLLHSIAEPDAAIERVPEAAIQLAWAQQAFRTDALRTTDGDPVAILRPGALNAYGGPDFRGAEVEIGGLRWIGDVEIHRTSREWEAHGHHRDPAYDRVVLHVVLGADRRTGTLRRSDGSALPELVLLPHLDQSLHTLLRSFLVGLNEAPFCSPRFADAPAPLMADWVHSLGTERLREKARALGADFGRRPDLGLLLTTRTFRALGYATNEDVMEALAARLPLDTLRALPDPLDVLARVLGLAGWLDGGTLFDAADTPLAARFEPFRDLQPATSRAAWRSGGRPANAPRRRLAQGAALLAPGGLLRSPDAVADLAAALHRGVRHARDLFRARPADGSPRLGADRAQTVLVNAGLPVLLLDAEMRGDLPLGERVMATMARLPAPVDHVTARFAEAGFEAASALDAQGLYRLERDYCTAGRCASCAIGRALYPGLAGSAT